VNALPHSPNAIWCSEGDMISLKNMSRIISCDQTSGLLTVQGGTTIQSILDTCLQQGRSFPSLPSIKTMTIAGAISTGAHGSGKLPPLPLFSVIRHTHMEEYLSGKLMIVCPCY
jgi:FAD/FMN-containing dehydrogenase